jgi:hypothetical protein
VLIYLADACGFDLQNLFWPLFSFASVALLECHCAGANESQTRARLTCERSVRLSNLSCAEIMEHVLTSNAELGYSEPTNAQLAAAAKMSIQELRGALAATSALTQVVSQGARILADQAARRKRAQEGTMQARRQRGDAAGSSEPWYAAPEGVVVDPGAAGADVSGPEAGRFNQNTRAVWKSLYSEGWDPDGVPDFDLPLQRKSGGRSSSSDMLADVRRVWGEIAS